MPGPGSISSTSSEKTFSTRRTNTGSTTASTEEKNNGLLSTIKESVTRGRSRTRSHSSIQRRAFEAQSIKSTASSSIDKRYAHSIKSDDQPSPDHPKPLQPLERLTKYDVGSGRSYQSYGRHSNEWLFGGFSFTETAKGFFSSGASKGEHNDIDSGSQEDARGRKRISKQQAAWLGSLS